MNESTNPAERPESTRIVLRELYDHLLLHPFFDLTVRRSLGIELEADVSERDDYWARKTQLIHEALAGLIDLNRAGGLDVRD